MCTSKKRPVVTPGWILCVIEREHVQHVKIINYLPILNCKMNKFGKNSVKSKHLKLEVIVRM